MPALQIRECPEKILKKLKELARRERRSLSQQALIMIEKGLEQGSEDHSLRIRTIDFLLSSKPKQEKKKYPDPAKLIREDRER